MYVFPSLKVKRALNSKVAFVAALAVASARPNSQDQAAPIDRQDSDLSPDGSWHNSWAGNGIQVAESGVMKSAEGSEVQGSAEWTSPEGEKIVMK